MRGGIIKKKEEREEGEEMRMRVEGKEGLRILNIMIKSR
jgi:hypothetical protein